MRIRAIQSLAVLFALVGFEARAADSCTSAEHRQFDFWIGEWQVSSATRKETATNRITREYGGCVVHERYSAPHGYSGESLNIYDASRKIWHQTWVDSDGLLLILEGGLYEGKMVLQGEVRNEHGQPTQHRITWTPNANGSVRQLWESTDASGKWTVAFDGLYVRK